MIDHHSESVAHVDGSQMFLRDSDRSRQEEIADRIRNSWGVDLLYLGDLSFCDYLAVKQARPLCWVEVISRNYDYVSLMNMGGVWLKQQTHATLLALGATALSVEWAGSVVVWHLTDGLYWKSVAAMEATEATAFDPRGAANDTEKAILVQGMQKL